MADIKFTIEYGNDKRCWIFKDPIKFEKEIKKIVLMLIFSQSIKYLKMGEMLSKIGEEHQDKKGRRLK